MGLKTKVAYVESLRKRSPEVYMLGERVDRVVDHRLFATGINGVGAAYDAAHDPQYRELAAPTSPLVNEPINRFTQLPQSADDVLAKVRLLRELCSHHVCVYRCMTLDMICALWATTYDIDAKYGTEYHQRFKEYVRKVQREDFILSGVITDVKGDRSQRPSGQVDKDMYLHIVERKSDGIVVRGAKASITAAPYAHELLVLPTRDLRENESEYAVAFATPVDAKGITLICRPPDTPREPREIERPLSSRYGHVESMVIFDDVFVPWERVFLCGEAEFAGLMAMRFANVHRTSKCGCKAGQIDLMIGAAALVADFNGVEKASHIQEKLCDMITTAEIAYSCGVTAAIEGSMHPSGTFLPKFLPANVGKFSAATKIGDEYVSLHDIGGGLVVTMPTEKDFRNPATGKYMEKYLKGREGVPVEHRIRAFKLIEDIVASAFGGWVMGLSINGAGSPMAEKIEILRQYNMVKRKEIAKGIAGIGD